MPRVSMVDLNSLLDQDRLPYHRPQSNVHAVLPHQLILPIVDKLASKTLVSWLSAALTCGVPPQHLPPQMDRMIWYSQSSHLHL